jgi:DNA-binding Xre family transcriptional regulator
MTENPHRGSFFDDFLNEEGILDEVNETALERVIAWQLAERMRERGMTKTELARRMNTSRSQVDRMLRGTEPGIGLGTLARGARALDCELQVKVAERDIADG